jgi:nuclear pore complex protein Nup107
LKALGVNAPFGFSASKKPSTLTDTFLPLHASALRVSREVEKFSQLLDNWYAAIRDQGPHEAHTATLRLLSEFRQNATSTVDALKRDFKEGDLRQQTNQFRNRMLDAHGGTAKLYHGLSSLTIEDDDPSVDALRKWQAEEATWALAQQIAAQEFPDPMVDQAKARNDRKAEIGPSHRYASDKDVWEHFLVYDNNAKTREIILGWLEQTYARKSAPIEIVTQELADKDEDEIDYQSTSGWQRTRNKIKIDKRLNSWSHAVDPSEIPYIGDRSGRIVTQLDPDAPLRQDRVLEASDQKQENFLWVALYELLRQGAPWKEIREFCESRNEGWHAVSLGIGDDNDSIRFCIQGPNQGGVWRQLCLNAAQVAINPYERAVYGLLCGDIASILPVCKTWEDQLHATYTSQLLSTFDSYLQKSNPLGNSLHPPRRYSIAVPVDPFSLLTR